MTAVAGVSVTCTRADMTRIAAVLASEAGGRKLKRDLIKNFRAAAEPMVTEIRSGLGAMPVASASAESSGEALTTAVAAGIGVDVRMGVKQAGVRVRAKSTPQVRNFRFAARRINSRRGWRHPVYGNRNNWVQQIGAPGFFDDPPKRHRGAFIAAAKAALVEMDARIAARARALGRP